MNDRKRVSLSFGDSPNEELAYAILQTKGRKKAEYVARCIAAYEKRKTGAIPARSVEILKSLLEQLVASLSTVPAPTDKQYPDMSANSVANADTSDSAAPSPPTPEDKPVSYGSDVAFNLDPELATRALDALNAFDAF